MISHATQLYRSTSTSHPTPLRASASTYMTSPNPVVQRTTPDSVPMGLIDQLEAKKREKNEKIRQIMVLAREIQGLQYVEVFGIDDNGKLGEKMKELEVRKAELGKLDKEINELMNQIDRIRNAPEEKSAPEIDRRALRYLRPATAVTVVQDAIVTRQTPSPATPDFDTRKLSPAMNPRLLG